MDCITKGFCHFVTNNNVDIAIKLMMKELVKHGLANQSDVAAIPVNITSFTRNKCVVNKIAYMATYLFDLPPPKFNTTGKKK